MKRIYLGLGTNEPDRNTHLTDGIQALSEAGLRVHRVSPAVESPALLPDDAPPQWNQPFLNLVLSGDLPDDGPGPDQFRNRIREIEDRLGRDRTHRWAPRPLDIDILLWGNERVVTETLSIPHIDLLKRNFVLTPLIHLEPDLRIPGFEARTAFEWSLELTPIPLWMGIINLTPDSFSDGGTLASVAAARQQAETFRADGAHIIDVGAESTRPGATPLTAGEEWARLETPLRAILDDLRGQRFAPRVSVDTRHPETAERCLELGVQLINDVSALTDDRMLALAGAAHCDWVVMHHVSVPADPKKILSPERTPLAHLAHWLGVQQERWWRAGVDPSRLYLDPGIGFGKDSLQSLKLLRDTPAIRALGMRLVVGHSRKSFLRFGPDIPAAERDLETIGASLRLCGLGVDVLRVHDVGAHVRAYRAWAHVHGFPEEAGHST